MSDLPTPTQVVLDLAELARLLDQAQTDLEEAEEKAVRARAVHEVAYAEAFLNASHSNAEGRKCMAIVTTKHVKFKADIADMQVRGIKTRLQVLRDKVHIKQSMGAAMRSEWAAS